MVSLESFYLAFDGTGNDCSITRKEVEVYVKSKLGLDINFTNWQKIYVIIKQKRRLERAIGKLNLEEQNELRIDVSLID